MNASSAAPSSRFFSHDPAFYRAFFSMLAVVAFQNLVSYSVNMADNIMLGAYSQEALSGAAVVNQIFFIVQQTSIAVGDSLIVLASQYWGQRRTGPIRRITGMVLKLAAAMGIVLLLACTFLEQPILRIFTSDQVILAEASGYLRIVKYSFALFLLTQVLLASLRDVETVTIAARLADQLIVIMAVVMIGMSYQMPVCSGIIRGSGDTKFSMYLNMISTWGIVMPLSFLAAFVWKWPVPAVVMCLQSDQIFKGLPIFLRFRSYKWIHHLTR